MSSVLAQNLAVARRLWRLTGFAIAAVLVTAVVNVLAPSFQRVYPLVLVVVSGSWAALCLMVLSAGARRQYKILLVMALGLATTLSVFTKWFGFGRYCLRISG